VAVRFEATEKASITYPSTYPDAEIGDRQENRRFLKIVLALSYPKV
jgi:hypothetical protein